MANEVAARWSADWVRGLAPDPASAKAARGLAVPAKWSGAGASERVVWGACQGSGKTPYRTAVAPAGPAFRCTCPSRKIPCKHVLALLLLWAAGRLPAAEEAEWVRGWPAEKAGRAARAESPKDPEAAEKRARERLARVTAGAAELRGWLTDRVAAGLAGLERGGGEELRTVAARMIDAQAPGLASGLHRAAALVGRGRGWPDRLLAELSLLHLLADAVTRLAELPAPLAATVRIRVGLPVSTAQVLESGERVADQWLITGAADEDQDTLRTRRTWLRGRHTGRDALVLSFAPPGRPLDNTLPPGHEVAGELAFHPGAVPLRAVFTERAEAVSFTGILASDGHGGPGLHGTAAVRSTPNLLDAPPSGSRADHREPTRTLTGDRPTPDLRAVPAPESRTTCGLNHPETGATAPTRHDRPASSHAPDPTGHGPNHPSAHMTAPADRSGPDPSVNAPAPEPPTTHSLSHPDTPTPICDHNHQSRPGPAPAASGERDEAQPDHPAGPPTPCPTSPPATRAPEPGTTAPPAHRSSPEHGTTPPTDRDTPHPPPDRTPPPHRPAAPAHSAPPHPEPPEPSTKDTGTIAGMLARYAAAVAADPWLERWPVLLTAVAPARLPDGLALSDVDGQALPLADEVDPWPLLAVAAEGPVTVAAEWTGAGLRPLTCWCDGRMVRL
ncbi:SWIM zinc finger protein [Amycolatopsis sulphurea]|uniref:SWIM zinc finger protein n=1 Tax=Amycolatopsis sulphurea TaxID=76022 RepID=A0A2A9FKB5_9PSEU|nr:SWIM zinc finger family protein [Amycolatopsis sulphurea]PFG50875.1 SWIM zinc finger protein [Amycolatopsis sulphurea]